MASPVGDCGGRASGVLLVLLLRSRDGVAVALVLADLLLLMVLAPVLVLALELLVLAGLGVGTRVVPPSVLVLVGLALEAVDLGVLALGLVFSGGALGVTG